MDDAPGPAEPGGAATGRPRRFLVASLLGAVGGGGAIGGMWLPLASLAGLGSVGCFDYSRPLVYPAIAMASLVVIFSFARCFRIVLLLTGILGGLLSAIGIELYQNLRDALNITGGDTAQMARQMIAHSSLQAGSFVLPLCGLACFVAGFVGSSTVRATARSTSGS